MTVCDLLTGAGHLQRATVELGRKWEETRESWQDETAREFERLHLTGPAHPHPTGIDCRQ